ncbi:MAG: dehydratase [Cohaesibacter sp.]|jgi:acyl dehydratase|nr:dehydratase [Cohaesibacter sp.]
MAFYFEQLREGDRRDLGQHRFTQEEITAFKHQFPIHDQLAPEQDNVHPWHLGCIWMNLMVDYMKHKAQLIIEQGKIPARMGPSPGMEEMTWLRPVKAGETLHYYSELTAKRRSRSRPQWGLLKGYNYAQDKQGDIVFSFRSNVFVECQNPHEED